MNTWKFSCAALVLILSACAPPPLAVDNDRLANARAAINQARSAGAEVCAPDAMSDAQAAYFYAAHELNEGAVHPEETSGLIATAEKRANDAYRQTQHGCNAELAVVNFDVDSAGLSAVAKGRLDRAATTINARSGAQVKIAGHTDSRASDSYNVALSQRRAAAVKQYLSSRGVDAGRMQSKGYGETRPVAGNDTDAGRAKNRRAEVWLSGK